MSKTPFLDPLTSDAFVSNVSNVSHGADPLTLSSNPLLQSHPTPRHEQRQEQRQQQRQQQRKSSPSSTTSTSKPATPLSKSDVKQPPRSNSAVFTPSTTTTTTTTTIATKKRQANTTAATSRNDRPKVIGGIADPLSSSPPTDSYSYQPYSIESPSTSPLNTTATSHPPPSSSLPHVEPPKSSNPTVPRPSSVVNPSSSSSPISTPNHQLPKNANTFYNSNRNTIASFPTISPATQHRAHPASEPNSSLPSPASSSSFLPKSQDNSRGNGYDDGLFTSPPSPRARRRDLNYDGQRVDASRIKAPLYLHITVPDTDRRAKDGMFVLNVQTNFPRYRRRSYQNITRSYLEFVRLREHLVAEHPETIVPVLPPERSLISLSDIEAIRTFLNRISKHPILSHDYELQMFIESEYGFLPQQQYYHNSASRSKTSLGRFLSFGVSSRFGYGSSSDGETDDEFEEERVAASKAETALQAVIKSLDREIKARRDYSSKELELAGMASAWANTEEDPEFSRTFKLLSKPVDGVAKVSKAQVGGDTAVMAGFLDYKLQHVQTLTQTLDYRLSVVSEYEAAAKSTQNKRKIMERLRSSTSINPDKVTDSIDDLDDAILFEGNMKTRMDQVTDTVQKELVEYRLQSTEDLFRALRLYTQRQISFEKAKLEELLLVGGDRFSDAMYTANLPPSFADKKSEAVYGKHDDGNEEDEESE